MDLLEQRGVIVRRHPWETCRFEFLRRILQDAGALRPGQTILDVGAGDAWLSTQLIDHVPANTAITCWDQGYEDSHPLAENHAANRLSWTRERPTRTFDLVLLLDVLEHIPDDARFLSETVRLNAGTRSHFLVTVPAWPMLFSLHDAALKHVRRYRPAEARRLLETSGLTVLEEGGFFHLPMLARSAVVLAERLKFRRQAPKDLGQWDQGAFITSLANSVLKFDNHLSRKFSNWGCNLPGLSYWALCQKKP